MNDVVIIGAGPAGVSCALYLKRAGRQVLILDKANSALLYAPHIENYYGTVCTGPELYKQGLQQLNSLQIPVEKQEVVSLQMLANGFEMKTEQTTYQAKHVVIATGNKRESPNIPGLATMQGKGVSYCAVCDGFFYKNKAVAVLGNAAYAIEEATYLKNLAKSVIILTNGQPLKGKFSQVIEKKIASLQGSETLETIVFEDGSTLAVQGLFVALGTLGATDMARKLGCQIENNKIVTNTHGQTNIPNLYACGDCTAGVAQIAKAVYQGMEVAMQIMKGEKE